MKKQETAQISTDKSEATENDVDLDYDEKTIGPYEIIEEVKKKTREEGKEGEEPEEEKKKRYVVKLTHGSKEVEWLLKMYDVEYASIHGIERLVEVTRIVSSVNFPLLENFYDSFYLPKQHKFCIVFERTYGSSMLEMIWKLRNEIGKRMAEAEIWHILVQGIIILNELHKYRIVHGNVNEFTLELRNDRSLRLTDFDDAFVMGETRDVSVRFGTDKKNLMK